MSPTPEHDEALTEMAITALEELRQARDTWWHQAEAWKAETLRLREREAVLVELLTEAIGVSEFKKLSRCIQRIDGHRECGGYGEGCPFHECPMRKARKALATDSEV